MPSSADNVIGARLVLDGEPAVASVKSFKTELREANQELISAAKNFGPVSAEALAAAEKVGTMKNEIADIWK